MINYIMKIVMYFEYILTANKLVIGKYVNFKSKALGFSGKVPFHSLRNQKRKLWVMVDAAQILKHLKRLNNKLLFSFSRLLNHAKLLQP